MMVGTDVVETLPDGLSISYIFQHPWSVLLPMTVGSVPAFVVVWIIFYWPFRGALTNYQLRRWKRHRARRDAAAREALAGLGPKGGSDA